MTDLVERVAKALMLANDERSIWDSGDTAWLRDEYRKRARAAIAVVLEEAARVAEVMEDPADLLKQVGSQVWRLRTRTIAAAIRALADKEG